MNRDALPKVLLILVLCHLPMVAGCSTFDRDWIALATTASHEAGIEDRWEGTWTSNVNGHDGALRCILAADAAGTLWARYHATYAGILDFEYTVPMTAWPEGDGSAYRFSAAADLGWLAGGRYEYEGTIAGDTFTSTYESKYDHGRFLMHRVREAGE